MTTNDEETRRYLVTLVYEAEVEAPDEDIAIELALAGPRECVDTSAQLIRSKDD